MKRLLLALILGLSLAVPTWADDPPPPVGPPPPPVVTPIAPPAVTGPESGDGTQEKPFVFKVGDKGKLTLSGTKLTKVKWNLIAAPKDTEILPGDMVLWFPTNLSGKYILGVAGLAGEAEVFNILVWFEIEGTVPLTPLTDLQRLESRVRSAFKGHPEATMKADGETFAAAVAAVKAGIEDQSISSRFKAYDALNRALTTNGWPKSRYPELGILADELFGVKQPDTPITPDRLPTITAQLGAIIKGCTK